MANKIVRIYLSASERVQVTNASLVLDLDDTVTFRITWEQDENDALHIRFTNFYEAGLVGGTEHNGNHRGPFKGQGRAYNPKRGKFMLRQSEGMSDFPTGVVNDRPKQVEGTRTWKYDIEWYRIRNNNLFLVDDLDPHVQIRR